MFLKEEVDADDVAEVVARWTGIPVSRLMEGETEKLIHMEERLHERVVGQDEAIEAVATALRRSRAGLQDPDRPIGSFLFLGPTGVGKTELARALAEFMFDSQDAMIRIDMSEYMEKHSVSRLVGAPPGYVGYEEGGQLTEAVRRRPYSVVLLDEIEKAHADVFNTLLQVMDDGRLTDGQGRTVDFKNTVLIMTSNIPVPADSSEAELRNALLEYFKPEFINRLDDIVRFHSLTRAQISEIVELQVARVVERVAERGVHLTLTDEAKQLLGNMGYDPVYGARPLRRVIQKQLVDRLALALLAGEIRAGDEVRVDAAHGEIVLETAGRRRPRHPPDAPLPSSAFAPRSCTQTVSAANLAWRRSVRCHGTGQRQPRLRRHDPRPTDEKRGMTMSSITSRRAALATAPRRRATARRLASGAAGRSGDVLRVREERRLGPYLHGEAEMQAKAKRGLVWNSEGPPGPDGRNGRHRQKRDAMG